MTLSAFVFSATGLPLVALSGTGFVVMALPLTGLPFMGLPLAGLPLATLVAGALASVVLVVLAAGLGAGLSSAAGGFSTVKRNLHLGQSIFRPTRLASLIGTCASQRGHSCLKLVEVAMTSISA